MLMVAAFVGATWGSLQSQRGGGAASQWIVAKMPVNVSWPLKNSMMSSTGGGCWQNACCSTLNSTNRNNTTAFEYSEYLTVQYCM